VQAFPHTAQNTHQPNIAISEVITVPLISNDSVKQPSQLDFCLNFNSCRNCSRTRGDTSNQVRAFPHISQNTHHSNISISEVIAAPLISTVNANYRSPPGYCFHFNFCGYQSRTCSDTSNQVRAFHHTSQNTHQSNISIPEAIVAPLPSTDNVNQPSPLDYCLHFNSCRNYLRTCGDTSNQV